MKTLRFTVSGLPRPAPRPRAYGQKVVPDHRADEWMVAVRLAAIEALGVKGTPTPGELASIWVTPQTRAEADLPVFGRGEPVSIGLEFFMPRKGVGTGSLHTNVPDLDNLVKAVKDALSNWRGLGAIAWTDDRQVARYHRCEKVWVPTGLEGVRVEIKEAKQRKVKLVEPTKSQQTGFGGRRLPPGR